MPGWLATLLKLAKLFGVPLMKIIFPKIGAEVWALIESILGYINGSSDKGRAVKEMQTYVDHCRGIACAADTKGLD